MSFRVNFDWLTHQDVRRTSGESSRSAYQGVVRLFADDPLAPFSIHKFAIHGRLNCDKALGEWFGPSAAASAIKWAMRTTDTC